MKMDILVAAAANAATTIAAASTGATPRAAAIFFSAGVCDAHHDVILQRFIPARCPCL